MVEVFNSVHNKIVVNTFERHVRQEFLLIRWQSGHIAIELLQLGILFSSLPAIIRSLISRSNRFFVSTRGKKFNTVIKFVIKYNHEVTGSTVNIDK